MSFNQYNYRLESNSISNWENTCVNDTRFYFETVNIHQKKFTSFQRLEHVPFKIMNKLNNVNDYIISQNIDRVLMGAQVTMAGLFPPRGRQIWNKNLNWRPIPVHSKPSNIDTILDSEKQCDRYDYEMIEYINSTEYKSLFEKHKSLINYLEENTGTKLNSILSLNHLYDKLFIIRSHGFPYVFITAFCQSENIIQTEKMIPVFLAYHFGQRML